MKRLRADGLDEGTAGIDWNGVKCALTDPKTWITAVGNHYFFRIQPT